MISPSFKRLLPLWFALGGLAFAIWLNVFLHDAKRPFVPQERADRLAAENYLAGSLTATVPPSPAHWAQLLVWQDAQSGARYPLARQASALAIAACGGNAVVASVLAFALASGGLAWLLLRQSTLGTGRLALLTALALAGVAHGRAWQMHDPFPYLVMAASTLALGAWLRQREAATKQCSLILALGFTGLLLCDSSLALLFGLMMALDSVFLRRSNPAISCSPIKLRALIGTTAILTIVLLAGLGMRNHLITKNALLTPASDYRERNVTAPDWFWQTLGAPQPKLDPVFERYDELVAIPQAHWANPVYQSWFKRLYEGSFYLGGLALALAALAAALTLPNRETRPAVLLCLGLAAISVLRYPYSSSWWPLLTPAVLSLACAGLSRVDLATGTKWSGRLIAAIALIHVGMLPSAPQAKPTAAEYSFVARLKEVRDKLTEKPGIHLVFTRFDDDADGRIEPADLRRQWPEQPILFARDLGLEKNSALAAAMPDRKPWRIIVFKDRIGLQPWTPAPDTKAHSTPVDAPTASPAPLKVPAG